MNKWSHRDLPALMSDIERTISDLGVTKTDIAKPEKDVKQALRHLLADKSKENSVIGWIKWLLIYVIPLNFIIFACGIRPGRKKRKTEQKK